MVSYTVVEINFCRLRVMITDVQNFENDITHFIFSAYLIFFFKTNVKYFIKLVGI